MTLEMTLAPHVSRVRLVGNLRLQNPITGGSVNTTPFSGSNAVLAAGPPIYFTALALTPGTRLGVGNDR